MPTNADVTVTGSRRFSLGRNDLGKILKGTGIALAGAFLAYLVSDVLPKLDDTEYAWVGAVGAILVNIAHKWLTNTRVMEIPLDQARTVIVTPQEAAQPAPTPAVIIVPPEEPPHA